MSEPKHDDSALWLRESDCFHHTCEGDGKQTQTFGTIQDERKQIARLLRIIALRLQQTKFVISRFSRNSVSRSKRPVDSQSSFDRIRYPIWDTRFWD